MVQKIKDMSIGTRLIILFFIITSVTYGVNIYMYWNINKSITTIDYVYVSNADLNVLTNTLENVQRYMYEYLNTKSSDALKNYYLNHEKYNELIYDLNETITDNEIDLMERKIRTMSLEYLDLTNETIQAKRGRNIEKYNKYYEEASQMYSYISTNIYSLNNEQFERNSNNYYTLLESLKYLEIINVMILLIVGLVSMFLITILTKNITKPLKKLANSANEVARGNFNIEFDVPISNDEIGIVTVAFKKMIINIQKYIKQIKESMEYEAKLKENELLMKNLLKDAQLKYLQAQINPHFLFNTLNAGVQLAIIEDAEQTGLFIEKTAEFFRYNINKINEDSTLEDEINLVDNYIYIMSIRLFQDINFIKNVDESLLKIRVPSMILQPPIENALNYGIRDIDWEGRIELNIYREGNNVCISVIDNGRGISKEVLDDIMKGEPKEADLEKNSNGIGLKNVISRLKLYFDNDNVLKIYSDGEGKGTRVTITIPIDKYVMTDNFT
ncbi:MAG: histidine kinase [Clostridiales bacterium]|nr:histidine kinase [Clostridiales bacterium]